MFSRQAPKFARGVRHQSKVAGAMSKVTSFSSNAVYWTKVVGELGKQVYVKEGMSPPSTAEIQSVYQTAYKQLLNWSKDPKQLLSTAKNTLAQTNKDSALKFAACTVQVVGLFSLGEIVGRRQIFGYPSFGPQH